MEDLVSAWEGSWSASDALRLVSAFFDHEWPRTSVNDVYMGKVTGGFCHRLHLLSRRNTANSEPSQVLIRNFGPEGTARHEPWESSTTLSAAQQAIVYHEMSRRCWGPKIYGLFAGGRIEEYVDSHPLTAAESTQDSVRRDVARAYARLHSLSLPIPRGNIQRVVGEFKKRMERKAEIALKLAFFTSPEAADLATIVRETDWLSELDWVLNLFTEKTSSTAIVIGDTNFLNVLVKKQPGDCQIMLIDYETATYGYRGIDIGGHFTERMYCWSDPKSCLTGYDAPELDEQRSFCASYLEEMRALNMAITANDTVEHLLLEARIGQLYQILLSVLMCFQSDDLSMLPDEAAQFIGLIHMMRFYFKLKEDFDTLDITKTSRS